MRSRRRFAAVLAVLWLCVGLVGTQTAGLVHRIEHPLGRAGDLLPGAHARGASAAHAGHAEHRHAEHQQHGLAVHGDEPAHDCAAYDAAALGAGPPVPAALPPAAAARHAPQPCAAAQLAGARLQLPWQSRAPPAA